MKIQQSPAAANWKQVGLHHHHGVCIPLFSLHSKNSCGIGEFLDIIPLLPWCQSLNIDIIQLLPLNDTGHEHSPYSALSAFALNPIHLSLSSLPDIDYQPLKRTQRISYNQVIEYKEKTLRTYYEKVFPQYATSPEYQNFVINNPWLENYSLFKTLKSKHNWQAWYDWKNGWKSSTPKQRQQLFKEYATDISYHNFLQFLCFQQMKGVFTQAEKYKIKLKGDIPILFSKDCADVWENPSLFHLNYTAGAPPDFYSPDGQYWGFPLYNWEKMKNNHFQWWKDRLKEASNFYHLYRLDHIVGFYRIWAKQLDHPDQPSGFFPPNPEAWIPHGENILRALLQGSDMLPIGEDLGTVPQEVKENLKKLGICGTKVIRWERKWEEDRSFIPFNEYESLSMTTVSTHDSETLKQWWKNQPEEAQEYANFKGWNYNPELDREHHFSMLYDSHHTSSLFHINLLQEYLAIIPDMTWPNPNDERINIPGMVSDLNWAYLYRPSVEELIENKALQDIFKEIIKT